MSKLGNRRSSNINVTTKKLLNATKVTRFEFLQTSFRVIFPYSNTVQAGTMVFKQKKFNYSRAFVESPNKHVSSGIKISNLSPYVTFITNGVSVLSSKTHSRNSTLVPSK